MLIAILFLAGGLLVLGTGAELMVRGSSRLALHFGISPLVVGLTIVAFGTSAPELAVSVKATLAGSSALALGNVIGSNIANIGLILGITALLRPIRIEGQLVRIQLPLVILSSILLGLLLLDGEITKFDGLILISGLIGYLIFNFLNPSQSDLPEAVEEFNTRLAQSKVWLQVLIAIGGLGLLIGGSQLFVDGAISLARLFGVSEAVIGLTIVAIGTSVPELATSLVAAFRGSSDIAIGNAIGSNLFNILAILGVTGLVGNVSGDDFAPIDFVVMTGFAAVLLPLAWSKMTLSRLEGAVLLGCYLAYLGYTASA